MAETLWTASEIAAVTQGDLNGADFPVTGISIDTRTIMLGDLFIALKGHNGDGHAFVETALNKKAAGVLVEQGSGDRHIVVQDTFRALQDLGAGARVRSNARMIAVTGSVGKTSVKAMLAQAFTHFGKTHAAEASLNNHWGVPLSLARMPVSAEYAVFEIGMNHAGEITPLSKLVSPHISIITTIAAAHIQYFGTIDNIALAKAEIFQGMDANGTAILPRDSEQFPILLAEARTQGIRNIITFGQHEEADIQLVSMQGDQLQVRFGSQEKTFRCGIPGLHQAVNLLSVLAAVHASGLDWIKATEVFANMQPVSGRGNIIELTIPGFAQPVSVIDETHNASPVAVEAALKVLSTHKVKGRRLVVLGDMLELGEAAAELHAGLAPLVLAVHADHVYLSGPMMENLAAKLPVEQTSHFPDSATLAQALIGQIQAGDTILIKGSHSSKMKLVVDALAQLAQSGDLSQPLHQRATAPTG